MRISQNAKTLLWIVGAVALVAAVYLLPTALQALEPAVCISEDNTCEHEQFADQLIKYMPLVLLAGMGIGAGAYYFFSERQPHAPKQLNKEAIYKLLDADERKVLAKIVDNGGKALQSELSYLEGLDKVKAHRIIERMVERGIVEKEAFGKTNVVKLNKDLQELFFQ